MSTLKSALLALATSLTSLLLLAPLVAQEIKLSAPEPTFFDLYGVTVSIDGDRLIVGSNWDDDLGDNSGSVSVYERGSSGWQFTQKLLASDGQVGDLFGRHAALSGDTVLVGAFADDGTSVDEGSAYVFVRGSDGRWSQQAKLVSPDPTARDFFAWYVDLDADTAVTGSFLDDDLGPSSGSAHVFVRNGNAWTLQDKLLASQGTVLDWFGVAVNVEGDSIAVGAPGNPDLADRPGATYVFQRNGSTWIEQARLVASDAFDNQQFGVSLALSGERLYVGAPFDREGGTKSGAVYEFTRTGSTWTETDKLLPSDSSAGARFGQSIEVENDLILVGADLDDDRGLGSGSAYVFRRVEGEWVEQRKLVASDLETDDHFGWDVSLDGNRAIAGAFFGDVGEVEDAGAVYVFENVASCVVDELTLCLQDGRFAVRASWQDFAGNTGLAQAVPRTADTGGFWFFDSANTELVVKVLDGTPINGFYWVFYGALSNVAFDLEVVDTLTGESRVYNNPLGRFASVGDTSALGGDAATTRPALLTSSEPDRERQPAKRPSSSIRVSQAGSGSFTVTPEQPAIGEVVAFGNTAADVDAFCWTFGDEPPGSPTCSSEEESPTHVYTEAGDVTVELVLEQVSASIFGRPLGSQHPVQQRTISIGRRCQVAASPAVTRFDSLGGPGEITVAIADGCSWSASSSGFLNLVGTTQGTGPATLTYEVAGNAGGERAAEIVITGPEGATSTRVRQEAQGVECDYSTSTDVVGFDPAGGRGQVRVSAPSGCNWNAGSDRDWLDIEGPGAGRGDGLVNFVVHINDGPARESQLGVANRTVEVRQSGVSSCVSSARVLCLGGGRFAVEADWTDFSGNSGQGNALPGTSDTGSFWFFEPANVELVVKVLDGLAINQHFWVFYGSLSNTEFTLTVTDLVTGNVRVYDNPSGEFASVGDTFALPASGSTNTR